MKFNENLYNQLTRKRNELNKIKRKLEKEGFDRLVEEVDDEIMLLSGMIADLVLAPIGE